VVQIPSRGKLLADVERPVRLMAQICA
jgi:hypothetical protein